uniref:Uncharacterized protein n=1 Tax=viral metagenome TaxID=1070528 RepID=A0A6C0CGY1_9ZZZZ
MIAALTAGSAVCCFGASYAAHQFFPVNPVNPEDALKNKSTMNTVNILTSDELKTRSLKERIDAYTTGRANLQDVMMVTAEKGTLNQAYVAIAKKIPTLPPRSEQRGQYEFLKKAADDHYSGFVPTASPPTDGGLLPVLSIGGEQTGSLPPPAKSRTGRED